MDIDNHAFYGRKEEIHLRFDAWLKVLDGQPQWISFVAESGVGKTRLVHEFYRNISHLRYRQVAEAANPDKETYGQDYDPDDYWPDSLPIAANNLGLNPDPERLSGTTKPCCTPRR